MKIGNKVLAKSEWKPENKSLSYEPITDVISTPNREQKWVYVTLSDAKVITATEGHPFRTVDGWRDAVLLKKGDMLILTGSDGKPSTIQINEIRYETKVLTTYNLEVANAHTFFVGEDAVLVHNGGECKFATSRQARRETMRNQGISTFPRLNNPNPNLKIPREGNTLIRFQNLEGGKEYKSSQQQTMDRSHPGENHWETGTVKTNPMTGDIRYNEYGRPKITNDKSKANYE